MAMQSAVEEKATSISIREVISAAREAQGMTQSDLADEATAGYAARCRADPLQDADQEPLLMAPLETEKTYTRSGLLSLSGWATWL